MDKPVIKHPFTERHPIISALLYGLAGWFGCQFIMALVNTLIHMFWEPYPGDVGPVGLVLGAVLVMLWYKRQFHPDFQGQFAGGYIGLGFLLGLFQIAYLAVSTTVEIIGMDREYAIPSVVLICTAFSAGITEELGFRGMLLGTLMRQWRTEDKIVPALLIGGAAFGLIHGVNLIAGAALDVTIIQVVAAAGIGVFLGAVYLRCGNLLPLMALHTFQDIMAFSSVGAVDNSGVITQELTWYSYVDGGLCLVLAAVGLWLVRREKRPYILALWDQKWGRQEVLS